MIDIHTHLLPGVDDGSPNMETSIKLIKEEIIQGVTDIFVTPHFYKNRGYYSLADKNKEIFNDLLKEIKKQNLDVNLFLGNEIYYNERILKRLREGEVITLNNSKYVLIEFSFTRESENMVDAVNNLTASGYIPIIAHPERYPYFTDIEGYEYLKRHGAMFQINASSLLGNYGRKIKKLVYTLLEANLVDFIASDIHDFRRANLSVAYKEIVKKFSKEKAEQLFNNKCILIEKT